MYQSYNCLNLPENRMPLPLAICGDRQPDSRPNSSSPIKSRTKIPAPAKSRETFFPGIFKKREKS